MPHIKVTVFPGSSKNRITQTKNGTFVASLKALPAHNQANNLLTQLLSDFLQIPTQQLKIISGHHSRHKRIEIKDDKANLNTLIEHKKTSL